MSEETQSGSTKTTITTDMVSKGEKMGYIPTRPVNPVIPPIIQVVPTPTPIPPPPQPSE
jgi:hypothetical protein